MKQLSALFILFLACIPFVSCKKEQQVDTSEKVHSTINVFEWLDRQKSTVKGGATTPHKDANIDLLKQNLQMDAEATIKRDEHNVFHLIPIKDEVKAKKHLDNNSALSLLLLTDNNGKIKWGQIVYFVPKDGRKRNEISKNIIDEIFHNKDMEDEGIFTFMSISGNLLYKLEYRDKKLYSSAVPKEKNNSSTVNGANLCIDWYLVTTYHYADGSSYTTEEYLGTTCDGCDNPDYQSFCPQSGSGGGGGGGTPGNNTIQDDVQEIETETDFGPDDVAPGATSYINTVYTYHAQIDRDPDTDEIEYVSVSPITADPMWAVYIDQYNRSVTRNLTLYGHYYNYTMLSATSVLINWACNVIGVYTYTDGSPTYTKYWYKSKSKVF